MIAAARSFCSWSTSSPDASVRTARSRARSALSAVSMWSINPLVPTTIVASVGTIMMRPSFDQIGRSRSRPAGRRRRDMKEFAVFGRLLTSPPSGSAPNLARTGHRRSSDPGRVGPPAFHHGRTSRRKARLSVIVGVMGCSACLSAPRWLQVTHSEYPSARVVLLEARPLGASRTSRIDRSTGACLDDFYKDGVTIPPPPGWLGATTGSRRSRGMPGGGRGIARLARDGRAEVPVYAIGADRRVATRTLDLDGCHFSMAEGIFAADIAELAGIGAAWRAPTPCAGRAA